MRIEVTVSGGGIDINIDSPRLWPTNWRVWYADKKETYVSGAYAVGCPFFDFAIWWRKEEEDAD